MSKLLIKGGKLIDPASNFSGIQDILISRGKIERIAKEIKAKAKVIDAKEMIVTPGLIDMHVHLREPGREDEETVASGSRAAAKGGFTTVVCMPNTQPPADSAAVIELILEKVVEEGMVNVYPVGAISKELKGETLAPMAELTEAGAVAFSDDGQPVMNGGLMRRALEYSKMFKALIITHAEDKNLSAKGQMNEGYYSTLLGLRGIPSAAEEAMIFRDLVLAEMVDAPIHVAHISTAGSVDLIRGAKKKGVKVTCEVTPHHLVLSEEDLVSYDTNFKINPPLRTKKDVEVLRKALADGTIDVIASDHAPHAPQEKEREFDYAPCGAIGLETTLPVLLGKVIKESKISLERVIEALTVAPAQALNLSKGKVVKGEDADITIINTQAKVKVEPSHFESKSANTPFKNWELEGRAEWVIIGGKIVVAGGKLI